MSNLPSQGLLASYWIPQVGIGPAGSMKYVDVPLTDILNYTLPNGQPQTSLVYLFCADFISTGSAPYVTIPQTIIDQMTVQSGQTQSNVQQLQAAGIKVVLSLIGSNGIGWDGISDPADFAQYVATSIVELYGLDGIDIDNENGSPANTQNFVNVIGALRGALPAGSLITKALWDDNGGSSPDYFTVPVGAGFPNAGTYLGQLLDLGSTMYYGYEKGAQISTIQTYQNIMVNGKNVGMNNNQLAIGVQAGPTNARNDGWMTNIDEVYELAQWCVTPPTPTQPPPVAGMMLFTFSQDIQQFTFAPQNTKMYPNADDHQWQRTITAGFLGEPQPAD